ncbi:hypothetical protein Pelo_19139 [Pelomyxa schiedti]|nr:hypothetical protein Pelo_19139 [Pelomyxa schiedti]
MGSGAQDMYPRVTLRDQVTLMPTPTLDHYFFLSCGHCLVCALVTNMGVLNNWKVMTRELPEKPPAKTAQAPAEVKKPQVEIIFGDDDDDIFGDAPKV